MSPGRDPFTKTFLAGCGKTTARLKNAVQISRFFVTEGGVLVAAATTGRSFPAQPVQLGVGLRRLHRQIPQAD